MQSLMKMMSSLLGRGGHRELGGYKLLEKIGQGGMGEVWRAEHKALGRPAAVKVVKREVLDMEAGEREQWLTRFAREARAMSRLQSPHTVRLYDYGHAEDGTVYYAMELLEGIDLETLVEKHGPLDPARVVYILEQVAASLAEAHALGLVHRDVKPGNIFLSRVGLEHDVVKVLDFGLVSGAQGENEDPHITRVNEVVGSPIAMAPEVVNGGVEVDARADVYALACVAYFLLTGSYVFGDADSTPLEVMLDHSRTTPDPLSKRTNVALPAGLEDLIMRSLEKDRDLRPRDGAELVIRLRAIASSIENPWTEADARFWWSRQLPEKAATSSARLETVRRKRPVMPAA